MNTPCLSPSLSNVVQLHENLPWTFKCTVALIIYGEQVYCTAVMLYIVGQDLQTSSGGEISLTAFSECVYAISVTSSFTQYCSL